MKSVTCSFAVIAFFSITSCGAAGPDNATDTLQQAHVEMDYEKIKVSKIYSESENQDKVQIKGKITGKVEPGTYLFKGESGKEILLHIDADEIPKKGLLFNSPTAIKGEVIKTPNTPVKVDADSIRYVF